MATKPTNPATVHQKYCLECYSKLFYFLKEGQKLELTETGEPIVEFSTCDNCTYQIHKKLGLHRPDHEEMFDLPFECPQSLIPLLPEGIVAVPKFVSKQQYMDIQQEMIGCYQALEKSRATVRKLREKIGKMKKKREAQTKYRRRVVYSDAVTYKKAFARIFARRLVYSRAVALANQ